MTLTAERLREVLAYDPETGHLTRIARVSSSTRIGDLAGTPSGMGYLQCRVDGRLYKCHRLAWLYVYGVWPKEMIDHVNGRRDDNRIENLRAVSRTTNMQNQRRAQRNNTTGLLGAHRDKTRYRSCIRADGRSTNLGSFGTAEDAHEAYLAAKRLLHGGCTI